MPFDIGPTEIIIIAVLVVFFFGSKKIPELTKGVADAIRHLRNAFKDEPTQESNVTMMTAKKK